MSPEAIALPQTGWTLRRWRDGDAAALQAVANDERIARWACTMCPRGAR